MLGEWEAIELYKDPKSRWAFGFVRFKKFQSADDAMRKELHVAINGLATPMGYGRFFCVKDIEKDGLIVIDESSYF